VIPAKTTPARLYGMLFKLGFCLILALSLGACGKSSSATADKTDGKKAIQPIAKHLPTYVCPMHPNVIRHHPGHCPICGMALVKKDVKPASHSQPAASTNGTAKQAKETTKGTEDSTKKKVPPIARNLPVYTCPMHSFIRQHHPGHCPICGMPLEKVKAGSQKLAGDPAVKVSPDVIEKLGVRTATVVRGDLQRTIRTVGYVAYDRDLVSKVSVATAGWVENLSKKRIGLRVDKGEVLVSLYSPEFLRVQKEYLAAQKKDKSSVLRKYSARRQSVAPRDQLRYMGISDAQAYDIARSGKPMFRIPVYAPRYGEIVKYNVKKDQFIPANYPMFTIADLSYVWVIADVYQHQVEYVQRNLKADVAVDAVPGQRFKGHVYFVNPVLDPKTRTMKVRLLVSNPHWKLRPNMFANVRIFDTPKSDVLIIPREALIVTGRRKVVIVDRGHGYFQPVAVTAGMTSGDKVEIKSGLKQGEKVVVSGQFLIDSEANLQASFQRFGTE
jgi:membrane fusion protein, copper/silver efflux system